MTAPVLTAWTFEFEATASVAFPARHGSPKLQVAKRNAIITVETPTKLGQGHAARVARCHADRMPWFHMWKIQEPVLLKRRSAKAYRDEQETSQRDSLRQLHASRPKRGPSDPLPRSPNEPNYRS